MADIIQKLKEVEAYLRSQKQGDYAETVNEVITNIEGLRTMNTVKGETYTHKKTEDVYWFLCKKCGDTFATTTRGKRNVCTPCVKIAVKNAGVRSSRTTLGESKHWGDNDKP